MTRTEKAQGHLNTSTLMLIDEFGEEVIHILDDPDVYPKLCKIEVPDELKEPIGTELSEVSICFLEKSPDGDQATYVIPELPFWIITLCRERGMLWGNLETPLVH